MSERKVTVARSKRPRGDEKSKEFVDLLQLTPTSRWLVIARDLSKKLHNSDESFTPMDIANLFSLQVKQVAVLMTVAGFSCINNEKITPKNLTSLEEVLRDVPKLIDRLHAGGDYNSDEYSAKAVRNTTADRAPAADVECEELTLTKDEWKRIHTGFQVIVNLRRGTPEDVSRACGLPMIDVCAIMKEARVVCSIKSNLSLNNLTRIHSLLQNKVTREQGAAAATTTPSPTSTSMTLRNGVTVPFVGFGCAFGNWTDNSRFMGFQPELGHFSVAAALRAGYTHFDCAYVYGSHRVVAQHVGQELSKGKKKRSDYFLTTKVCHPWSENALNNIKKTFNFTLIPNCDIRERVFIDFETSLDELSVGYVDLLLMHWPGAFNSIDESVGRTKRRVCWETFEEIYTTGKTRAIGVSNFQVRHLVALLEDTKIVPMVNQIEISPYIQQPEVVSYCMEKDIKLVAWSPFGSGSTGVLTDPTIVALGKKYNKNSGQVILRWLVQKGIGVLPKSSSEDRMSYNLDIFDFEIVTEDMVKINGLDKNLSCVVTSDGIA